MLVVVVVKISIIYLNFIFYNYLLCHLKVKCSTEITDAILMVSNGDMRKAVTTLQSVHQFYGKAGKLSKDNIREISGNVDVAH